MFTIHYDSSLEELETIKLGDEIGYGGGAKGKVVKIMKELSNDSVYFEISFENGFTRPILVLNYASKNK